ncbi:MAG: hypothetical protein OHK0038_02510 [Flammeovirgaceae bacterium]
MFNDIHFVPDVFLVLRTGLTYKTPIKNLNTTLGYGYLNLYPSRFDYHTLRPEHRVWGQTTYNHSANERIRFSHRARYEARFRHKMKDDEKIEGYNFNWRWRYMVQIRYNFPKKDTQKGLFYAWLAGEILVNSGKEIKNNFRTDQYRLLLGAGYQINSLSFQLMYINRTVLSASADIYTMNHTLGLWVFHQIQFGKELKN